MPHSTPFRSVFSSLISAVHRFQTTSIEIGTCECFGVDHALN